MARKSITLTLQDRDQELTFKIKEMSAVQLEGWMCRALLLMAGSGIQVPNTADIRAAGAYLAEKGLVALGNVDFEKAQPLLDELLGCCSRVVEKVQERCTPATVDAYIQDVKTLFTLRMEALKLNLGFSMPDIEKLSGYLGARSTETE